MSTKTDNEGKDQKLDQDSKYSGYDKVNKLDLPAIIEAVETVMKYTRREGDTMQLKDVEHYIDALLKFSTFSLASICKLIDLQQQQDNTVTTTTPEDLAQVMKRYASFYS